LLIGLQIEIMMLLENWQPILWAITAVLVSRAVVVYSLSIFNKDIPLRWQHVLYWGGLRGALAPALAISLPIELGDFRGQIQAMVFGVVLFNLLVQGISLGPFVRRLKLVERTPHQDEYERRHARSVAIRSAIDHLEARSREGLISDQSWRTLSKLLKRRHQALIDAVSEVMLKDPEVEAEELDTAWRETLRSQRSTYSSLLTDGFITEDTFEYLVGEVDLALMESQINWASVIQSQHRPAIRTLITVFLHRLDEENAINALNKLGFSITRLPNEDSHTSQNTSTLLIGASQGSQGIIQKTLLETCLNADMIEIFGFDVERFVEL
jgi:NhaP-type Na+/H+ or K+/H+ antiporter